jgi:class 3 adenylate cyclase
MALFGAPRAHGDDALRAVRAALEIQSLVPVKLGTASSPLAAHIALVMGDVVTSRVGSDRRREYTVIGEAANLAARLLDRAQANEILASEEIRQATARLAEYEALGEQSFKGLDNPVPVFRLSGDEVGLARSSATSRSTARRDARASRGGARRRVGLRIRSERRCALSARSDRGAAAG